MNARATARRQLTSLFGRVVEREQRDLRRQRNAAPRTSFRRLKEIERALLRAKRRGFAR